MPRAVTTTRPAIFQAVTISRKRNGGDLCVTIALQQGKCWREFSPETPLLEIAEWAANKDRVGTYTHVAVNADPMSVHFSNDTGKLVIGFGSGERSFDPNSDESLASMVRHIKTLTPAPNSDRNLKPKAPLPRPTEEQLANRTILSNTASAYGVGRYNNTLNKEETSKEIDLILGGLLKSGIPRKAKKPKAGHR